MQLDEITMRINEAFGEDLPVLLLRAEHEAVDAAMLENAKALTAFLEASR